MGRLRFFEFNELDALICSGEGLLGGPPTRMVTTPPGRRWRLSSLLLEAREPRRSFGGGMGSGEDIADSDRDRCIDK
jgi:hypothetical protein